MKLGMCLSLPDEGAIKPCRCVTVSFIFITVTSPPLLSAHMLMKCLALGSEQKELIPSLAHLPIRINA